MTRSTVKTSSGRKRRSTRTRPSPSQGRASRTRKSKKQAAHASTNEATANLQEETTGEDEVTYEVPICSFPLRDDTVANDPARAAEMLQKYTSGLYTKAGNLASKPRKGDLKALERILQGRENTGSSMTPPVPALVRDAQAIGDALAAQKQMEQPASVLEDVQMYDRNNQRVTMAIEKHLYKLARSKLIVRMDEEEASELHNDDLESQKLHDYILTPHYRNYLETVRECAPGSDANAPEYRNRSHSHAAPDDLDVYENANGHLPHIEEVPRFYFFDFYRTPIVELGETPCAAGHHCKAIALAKLWKHRNPHERVMIPPETPLRAFYLQHETERIRERVADGEAAKAVYEAMGARLCILCLRSATNDASDEIASDVDRTIYSKATAEAAHMNPIRVVQNHSYIFDREGEYSSQVCMMLCGQNFQGIIQPFLQFNMRLYEPAYHSVTIPSTGNRRRLVGWADAPEAIYDHAADGFDGVLKRGLLAGEARTTGLVRVIETPELLRKALHSVEHLDAYANPGASGGLDAALISQSPGDERVTAEIERHLEKRFAGRHRQEKLAAEKRIARVRALLLSSTPSFLPVEMARVQTAEGTSDGDAAWEDAWVLTVEEEAGHSTPVHITTAYWNLRSVTRASVSQCRYYQALAARINYLYSMQNTLNLYVMDEAGRMLRKKKRHVVRDRSVASLQTGMLPNDYYRLKEAYRGVLTNLDIVEELHCTPDAEAQDASDEPDSDSEDTGFSIQASFLREESTIGTETDDEADFADILMEGSDDDDIDIESLLQQLRTGDALGTGGTTEVSSYQAEDVSSHAALPSASGVEGDDSEEEGEEEREGVEGADKRKEKETATTPKRTRTHRDHTEAKRRQKRRGSLNVFGHSAYNKKRQLRRRHTHNPKARNKLPNGKRKRRERQKASGTNSRVPQPGEDVLDADAHAIRKRRQYSRESYINKLIKRFLRAYTPLVRRMHALAEAHNGRLTDAILEADVHFMYLWVTFSVPYEYHPGDALHMQWYTTEVPRRSDPFATLTEAGYLCTYPEGIDAVYACAVAEESASRHPLKRPLWKKFHAFHAEVLAYEWHKGLGCHLWHPTLLADPPARGRRLPPPPPLAGHAVFWTTYYHIYQLELAARGRPPGICRDRRTVPPTSPTAVGDHLRLQAQHVLTAYLPLACYLRHEWAVQFHREAAPEDSRARAEAYRARVLDADIPLDIYRPSDAHILPAAHSPELLEYDRHLQHIDFWYERTGESDIIAQIISKCLPYGSHGRKNTNLGRQTIRKKPVYQLFVQRVCRLVFYGLYDLETWDAPFQRASQRKQREADRKATGGRKSSVGTAELLDPVASPPYTKATLHDPQTSMAARGRKRMRMAHCVTRSYRPPLAAMCRMEEEVFHSVDAMSRFVFVNSSSLYATCVCIFLLLLVENRPSLQKLLLKTWTNVQPVFMRIGHMARMYVGSCTRGLPSVAMRKKFESEVHALRKTEFSLLSFPKGNFTEMMRARINEIKILFYAYTFHDTEALQCMQLARHHLAYHYAIAPGADAPSAHARYRTAALRGGEVPGSLLSDAGKPFSIPANVHLSEDDVQRLVQVFGADHIIHMLFQLCRTTVASEGMLPAIEALFDGPRDVTHYATAFVDELYGPLQHSTYRRKAAGRQDYVATSPQRPRPREDTESAEERESAEESKSAEERESTRKREATPGAKRRGPVPRNHMVGKKVPITAVRHIHIASRHVNLHYERNRARLCKLLHPLALVFLHVRVPLPELGTHATAGERLVWFLEEGRLDVRDSLGPAARTATGTPCEQQGGWRPVSVATRLLRHLPVSAVWDAMSLYYRFKTAHLAVLQQRVTSQERATLWSRAIQVKSSKDADSLVRSVIPPADLPVFKQLLDLYEERASAALLESKVAELQGRTVFLISALIEMRRQIYNVCTVPLSREDAAKIQYAMAHKRYAAVQLDNGQLEQLPNSVYDVYATPCCERVATISSPSSFGHFRIRYDSEKTRYTCDMHRQRRKKRKQSGHPTTPPFLALDCALEGGWVESEDGRAWIPLLPAEENTGGVWLPVWVRDPELSDLSLTSLAQQLQEAGTSRPLVELPATEMEGQAAAAKHSAGERPSAVMFHSLDVNSQRQLCRKQKKEEEDVQCRNVPPLYRVNLKESRLYFGDCAKKRQAFQFCTRCGNFDAFTDANWSYHGYACRSCRQKTVPSIIPQSCDKCMVRDKGTQKVVPMVHLSDPENPIQLRRYCAQHQNLYREAYTTHREHVYKMRRANGVMRFMHGTQTARERHIISKVNARVSRNRNNF